MGEHCSFAAIPPFSGAFVCHPQILAGLRVQKGSGLGYLKGTDASRISENRQPLNSAAICSARPPTSSALAVRVACGLLSSSPDIIQGPVGQWVEGARGIPVERFQGLWTTLGSCESCLGLQSLASRFVGTTNIPRQSSTQAKRIEVPPLQPCKPIKPETLRR